MATKQERAAAQLAKAKLRLEKAMTRALFAQAALSDAEEAVWAAQTKLAQVQT